MFSLSVTEYFLIWFQPLELTYLYLLLKNVTLFTITLQADHAIAKMNALPMFPYTLWMSVCVKIHHANDCI